MIKTMPLKVTWSTYSSGNVEAYILFYTVIYSLVEPSNLLLLFEHVSILDQSL